MHEHHDLDLVAAFAGHDFDGNTFDVEALLESCVECRAELARHTRIRETLASVPQLSMTTEERLHLRRTVQSELTKPTKVVPIASRRRWIAIGSVAAASLLVLGVAGSLLQGLPNSADIAVESAKFDDADLAADTSAADTAAADEAPAATMDALEEAAREPLPGTSAYGAPEGGFTTAQARTTHLGEIPGAELVNLLAEILPSLEGAEPLAMVDVEVVCSDVDGQEIFAVVTAIVDGSNIEALAVKDPQTSELRFETRIIDGCAVLLP